MPALAPLPYHLAVRDHLRAHAEALWTHFASDAWQQAHAEELRLALLKATVRLDAEHHPELHAHAAACAKALGLGVPVELYQGPGDDGLNAALYFVPDAARVVLFGPLQERLEGDELRALLGHELAHHLLWTLEEGQLLVADRVLGALAQAEASTSATETARLYQLHTEAFCDRAGMHAAGDRDAAIRCLIKVKTSLKNANASAYLKQADEVLAAERKGSAAVSHPEPFLRAKALALFAEQGAACDPELRSLLEGPAELDRLDLLRRHELHGLVRDLLDLALQPPWMQTEATLGHARLMLDDYTVPDLSNTSAEGIATTLAPFAESSRDALGWILVDLVAVARELEPLPLAHVLGIAEGLGLRAMVEKAVNKELRVTRKAIAQTWAERDALLAAAASSDDDGDDDDDDDGDGDPGDDDDEVRR